MENSTSFRAMAFLTPGLEFVSEYKWPLLMVTTAVAIGTLIMHHRYLENTQAQARDKLYTQLYDTYDRTATQLVFQFEQAKMENDPQAMEACRQIARKIQGNLEYIKLDLAKCEKSLSTQEQDQIVSKVTEALDYVLKNSES